MTLRNRGVRAQGVRKRRRIRSRIERIRIIIVSWRCVRGELFSTSSHRSSCVDGLVLSARESLQHCHTAAFFPERVATRSEQQVLVVFASHSWWWRREMMDQARKMRDAIGLKILELIF